ncbi:gephyrin-like molybdotransferase receptor GlpR [Saccharopolyspora sp. MS10]|uniref:divisome protein SepX/GlpR n=1 Tax=Saccharopolyspora sp. MS10 TaxID=3385973 RepID=UPI00399EED47
MPSSLIFAALAAAWLVVLVPMFARRRQEVSKTTDSALAARVVRRGSDRSAAGAGTTRAEAHGMADTDRHEDIDPEELDDHVDEEPEDDDQRRRVHSDDVRAGRRYRPGRGGFDPEAAALAARTKYARRQRITIAMVLLSITTALLAALVSSALWWVHGIVDVAIVGYLAYLRHQVRIEQTVRERRLARLSGAREEDEDDELDHAEPLDEYDERDEVDDLRGPAPRSTGAVVVEIDDEDPMFDELDERTWQPYRRAVGE